jgi:DNA-binding NarL/FixJ family response regulator
VGRIKLGLPIPSVGDRINIAIVDDHELFLTGVCSSLQDANSDFSISKFVSAKPFIESLNTNQNYDLLIIDLAMKGINGLALISLIRRRGIKCPILILTGVDNPLADKTPQDFGANMLVPKSANIKTLTDAIYSSIASFQDENTASEITDIDKISDLYSLTSRQLEVISLAALGKNTGQIAGELSISENTVKHHFKSIYNILQVSNLAACLTRVRELGYL